VEIVDAQIHLWGTGLPSNLAHRQVTAFTPEEAIALMDEGGVDAAEDRFEGDASLAPGLDQRPVEGGEHEQGTAALLEALEGLAAGTLSASPQPPEGVTYAPRIEKAEARINWSHDALQIERQIRAFNPWPVAETVLDGEPLRILAAQAEPATIQAENSDKSDDPGAIIGVHDDFMRVRCGRGCLRVTEVQRPGRRRVAVRDYSHSVALTGRRLG